MPGTLYVAATPIGNPGDASQRLRTALADSPVIAAEDTRRLRRLADQLQIPLRARVVSLFEGNENRRAEELVELLADGDDVVLVSDAGTPVVSDPGQRLVSRCAEAGIRITALPGPSAVAAAVAVSGLVSGPFCFEGFLPRKAGERRSRLAQLAADTRPTVFFESPRRAAATLADLATAWGDRAAVVCRELTKTHEELRRGSLPELATWAEPGLLGEITIVVAGASGRTDADPDAWRSQVAELVAAGVSRRDAVDQVATLTGAPRRAVYQASLSG